MNEQLRKENYVLTKETKDLKTKENETINMEKENVELKEETVKAKKQVKNMKTEILCKKKEDETKYNVLQETIDKVNDDLVNEVESHKISKNTIVELEAKAREAEQRFKKYSAAIRVLLKENQDLKLTVQK